MARQRTPRLKSEPVLILDDPDMGSPVSAKGRLRYEIVAMERSGRGAFMDLLRSEGSTIRSKFDEGEKRELRRGIEHTLGRALSSEDVALVDSIFGPLRPSRPTVPVREERPFRPMTPEEGIEYMGTCTFECFCNWMECSRDFIRGLDEQCFTRLLECIFHVCEKDAGLPYQRHVAEGDLGRLTQQARRWHNDG